MTRLVTLQGGSFGCDCPQTLGDCVREACGVAPEDSTTTTQTSTQTTTTVEEPLCQNLRQKTEGGPMYVPCSQMQKPPASQASPLRLPLFAAGAVALYLAFK